MTFQNIPYLDTEDPGETYEYPQTSRQDLFIAKLRGRGSSGQSLAQVRRPSRDISINEFSNAYSAAEFALCNDAPLDTHLTIDFSQLGISDPREIQKELSGFFRRFGAWATERNFPPLYIASVELGNKGNHHAHIMLHVPGKPWPNCPDIAAQFRQDFRKWCSKYTDRNADSHINNAFHVSGGLTEAKLRHWIIFHYLMKGHDRSAVLVAKRNAPSERAIFLSDMIARPYHNSGDVMLRDRVIISQSLGPKNRNIGTVPGREEVLLKRRYTADKIVVDHLSTDAQLSNDCCPAEYETMPFQSTFEAGIYDVRRLYGPEFCNFVWRGICEI